MSTSAKKNRGIVPYEPVTPQDYLRSLRTWLKSRHGDVGDMQFGAMRLPFQKVRFIFLITIALLTAALVVSTIVQVMSFSQERTRVRSGPVAPAKAPMPENTHR